MCVHGGEMMRVTWRRGRGAAVLFWFAFAAAAAKVRAGTVPLERCLKSLSPWPEETGVPIGAPADAHDAQDGSAADVRYPNAMRAASAAAAPPNQAHAPGPIVIPLPAPLLIGTVGLLSVATALVFLRVRRAV